MSPKTPVNITVAVVLSVLFGVLGLLYVSVKWALILIGACVAFVVTIWALGSVFAESGISDAGLLVFGMLIQLVGIGLYSAAIILSVVLAQKRNAAWNEFHRTSQPTAATPVPAASENVADNGDNPTAVEENKT